MLLALQWIEGIVAMFRAPHIHVLTHKKGPGNGSLRPFTLFGMYYIPFLQQYNAHATTTN